MNLDDLTYAQLKELAKLLPALGIGGSVPSKEVLPAMLSPGQKVFIRTVTWHFTGEIVSVTSAGYELKEAAWIADAHARHADFLKDGPSSEAEIEPYPNGVVVPAGPVIDVSPWSHPLPRKQG